MGETTRISWANRTLNFWTGCTKVSPGCDNCYAESMQNRLHDPPEAKLPMFKGLHYFDTVRRTKTWGLNDRGPTGDPARWQREAAAAKRVDLVFTCSLSDFFIQAADQWRPDAWQVIRDTPNMIYQILTKRPNLIKDRLPPDWGRNGYPNVWLGVSVENKQFLKRMDVLNKIPAVARFVSAEPLLEDITPELQNHIAGFDQIIVGGESGNRSENFRAMSHDWARNILFACRSNDVAFFFKQSAATQTEMGTMLDGQEYKEWPKHLDEYRKERKKKTSTLF